MLPIFLFSFNRGRFLKNCLQSIELAAPNSPVTIIDDDSDDPETLRILESAACQHDVIQPHDRRLSESKTGGLYNNLNLAINLMRDRKNVRALFLQDDMQFVRRLTQKDIRIIDAYFAANPTAIQMQTCFIRREDEARFRERGRVDASATSLIIPPDLQRGKDTFSAVGVFDASRVAERLGSFEAGEGRNNITARRAGIVMGRAIFPFINWLPYPISHRDRSRGIAHGVMEWVGGAGYHPIAMMTADEEVDFLSRSPDVLPIAERFLRAPTAPRHDRWSTAGGEYHLLARGGWRAAAFRSLLATKRAIFGRRSPQGVEEENRSAAES